MHIVAMNIQKLIHNLINKPDPSTEYWELLRFVLGAIFMWVFLDKTFGLGIPTDPTMAWIHGASPTYGFLTMGVKDAYFSSVFRNGWQCARRLAFHARYGGRWTELINGDGHACCRLFWSTHDVLYLSSKTSVDATSGI